MIVFFIHVVADACSSLHVYNAGTELPAQMAHGGRPIYDTVQATMVPNVPSS